MQIMKEVERSPLSISQYFQQNATPFGRTQYYMYKRAMAQCGIQGLYDQRSHGNSVKFTCDMKHFVKDLLSSHRSLTSSEVQQALAHEFGATISLTVMNDFRRAHDVIRAQEVFQESGASEMLIALVLDSGFINTITDVIYQHVQRKKTSDSFRESVTKPNDHSELRSHGRFTSEYNHSPDVRASKFQSLDEKTGKKRLVSMGIFSHSRVSMIRYILALFSLPLVAVNGRV